MGTYVTSLAEHPGRLRAGSSAPEAIVAGSGPGAGVRRAAAPARRAVPLVAVIPADGGPPERTFIGGLWSAGDSAIWPLARLELFGWGIGVRSSTRLLSRLISAWHARYEDIGSAQRIFVPIASRGVCIRPVTAQPVVFWSRRGPDILQHLQLRGVRVDWSVGRVPWGAHLDHR